MIQAISACPTTVREILELADKVEKDESRVDEVVDGLIDPHAKERLRSKKAESPEDEEAQIEEEEGESEEDEGAAQSASPAEAAREALEKFARIRRLYDRMAKALENKGSKGQGLLRRARPHLQRADGDPLHRAHRRAALRQRAKPGRRDPPPRAPDPRHLRREGADAAPSTSSRSRRHEGSRRWLANDISAAQPWSEALRRLEPSILELLGKIQAVQQKTASRSAI